MERIVRAALDHAAAERQDADRDEAATPFGPPRAAVVGCGAAGAERVGRVTSSYRAADDSRETVLTTAAVSCGRAEAAPRAPGIDDALVWDPPAVEGRPAREATAAGAPERLSSLVDAADIRVLTGALGDAPARRLLVRAAALADGGDAPTVVVPTLPADPLDAPVRDALAALRATADCLVPVDPGHLAPASDSAPASDPAPPAVADVTEQLLSAVLGSTSSSMAFPVDLATVHDLLGAGHVAVPVVATLDYDATLARSPPDRAAIEASLRTCYDGAGLSVDASAPEGWLAYLVAGDDLTLRAFQRLERALSEVLVDDADVPSVRGGHIEASREGVGLLSCLVFLT